MDEQNYTKVENKRARVPRLVVDPLIKIGIRLGRIPCNQYRITANTYGGNYV